MEETKGKVTATERVFLRDGTVLTVEATLDLNLMLHHSWVMNRLLGNKQGKTTAAHGALVLRVVKRENLADIWPKATLGGE